MKKFNGKVAVVTGGGGILCSVMAKALADAGAKVAILDLREENAKKVQRLLLTWITDEPTLYGKISKYISPGHSHDRRGKKTPHRT